MGNLARAQADLEYEVKAGFVLNFLRFTQYPTRPHDRFLICVSSDAAVLSAFKKLETQTVDGRSIQVRSVGVPGELSGCNELFVAASGANDAELLAAARRHSVLSVGEVKGFLAQGGMIRFFNESNRIRFEINKNACDEAGLVLSSRLLGLARVVDR